jgi:hypothetical protein
MYYSMQQGVHATWRDYAQNITNNLSSKYVLPTAIAAMTGLWLGLIIIAYNQTSPVGPAPPTHISRAHSGQTLAVSYSQPTVMTPSPSNGSAASAVSSTPTVSNNITPSTPVIATDNLPSVGGKGGDGTDPAPVIISPPVTPDPIVDPAPLPVVPPTTEIIDTGTDLLQGITDPLTP